MDERALAYLRTLVYAALLGIPVAFAAVLFQTAIHDVAHVTWVTIPDELGWSQPAGWYVILVVGLAGLLVAGACRLPGGGGHSPLQGLSTEGISPGDLWSILLAGLASLALGAVLGPEAPLIALGLVLGVVAARLTRMEGTEGQLLGLAGAFAAIAALIGGPLVAAFLLFEITTAKGTIPAQALGRALLPGFVAAGAGALVFTGVQDWPGLHQASLAIPSLPAYETVQIDDLAWSFPLAAVVAIIVVGIRHGAHEVAARSAGRPVAVLVGAGLLIGGLAVTFRAVTDEPVDLVLFSGQQALPDIVVEGSAGVLAFLVVTKGLAYALSMGAGFRGGPIFPALAIGTATGVLAADILPGLDLTPAVAVGLAAATSAVLRIPFTAVLLASLLVGSSATEVAPIAVLAAATGWVVAVALPNPEDRAAAKEAAKAAAAPEPAAP
jgi:H+/Cl- antiporter ClcA